MGIRFGPDFVVNVWGIKVVEHADPLFLIGADILCGGSGGQNTCFNSIWALGGGQRRGGVHSGALNKDSCFALGALQKGPQGGGTRSPTDAKEVVPEEGLELVLGLVHLMRWQWSHQRG